MSRNRGFVHLAACTAIWVALWIVCSAPFAAAQSSWQGEWEKTVRAAEAEGQVVLYGCCYDYDRVLEVFRKRYPKIKPNIIVAVAGNSLASRILAERRAEKYLVDVVSSGASVPPAARSASRRARPIPMRRKFSSTGCCPGKGRSRCRSSAVPTRTIPAASIFQKTTSILTTVLKKARNISIWPDRSTKT
jgi:hypothetical protein